MAAISPASTVQSAQYRSVLSSSVVSISESEQRQAFGNEWVQAHAVRPVEHVLVVLGRQLLEEPWIFSNPAEPTSYEHSYQDRSSEVTLRIEAVLSWLVSKDVLVPHHGEVRDYLLRHQDMIDLVAFACGAASERFQTDSELALELYRDPEIENEYLTLYVRREQYKQEILDEIDLVSAEFEDNLTGKSGWFVLTTDFRLTR